MIRSRELVLCCFLIGLTLNASAQQSTPAASAPPGISSYKTIMANHCSEFINSPHARPGSLKDNPIHADMLYAAKTAGLCFILNVVLNGKKEVIAAITRLEVEGPGFPPDANTVILACPSR